MRYADDIQTAIDAMRQDSDRRWHAVADLLAGGPLGYARLIDNRSEAERAKYVSQYPDAERGLVVALAYLGN